MIDEARTLLAVLQPKGIPLLINDRVDVALAAKAQGVHIGQDDMPAEEARRLLGADAIIGLSIKTLEQAPPHRSTYSITSQSAASMRRTSKDNTSAPIGTGGLRAIATAIRARKAKFPICAIAGITAANAGDVIAAGADGVSVISALSLAPQPAQAARELRRAVDKALARRGRG